MSGHRFSDAAKTTILNGFSHRVLADAAPRLKPVSAGIFSARLKPRPDTDLVSDRPLKLATTDKEKSTAEDAVP
ncbi:MAG TPA: hypothetical protein VH079_04750 [Terriglobales bacterium]|nr:hypothetical protein [Terriglobales bacterium]